MGLSLVYVVVCRLFELVVLLGRRERSKELEILVLRHQRGLGVVGEDAAFGVDLLADDVAEGR